MTRAASRCCWPLAAIAAGLCTSAPAAQTAPRPTDRPVNPPTTGDAQKPAGKPAPNDPAPKDKDKKDDKDKAAPLRPVVVLQTYDEATSRAVFTAIDRNADDRLSVFEFAASQDEPAAADPRDPTVLRRFDTDRDGFLNWPEFDARMRNAIRLNGEFRYRPARQLPPIKPAMPVLTDASKELLDAQVQGLLALLDTDRSGKLSRDEFATLLSSANLPASSLTQFVQADRDNDRQLDSKELEALTRLLPNLPRGPQMQPSARSFSVAWRRADIDGDGKISTTELDTVLRSHDVHLGRWVSKVIADADRTGDRHLGPAEVFAAQRDADAKPSEGTPGGRR